MTIKTSIVASLLFATSVNAQNINEELLNALEHNVGNIAGSIKLHYHDVESNNIDGNVGSVGSKINYVSPSYENWKASIGGQFAHELWGQNSNSISNGINKSDGFVLSNLYLQFAQDNYGVKIGRQYLHSPLITTSNNQGVIDEAIQGILWGGEYNHFHYGFGWFNNFQTVSDKNGNVGHFDRKINLAGIGKHHFENIYTLYIANEICDKLTTQLQYVYTTDVSFLNTKDNISILHISAQYDFKFYDQEFKSKVMWRNSGGLESYDGNYIGGSIGMYGFNGLDVSFAYGQTNNKDLIAGLGKEGADKVLTSMMLSGGEHLLEKDTRSFLLDVGYDFGKSGYKGLSTKIQYGFGKQNTEDFHGIEGKIVYYGKNNLISTLSLGKVNRSQIKEKNIHIQIAYTF
jgi:hypothetical protein